MNSANAPMTMKDALPSLSARRQISALASAWARAEGNLDLSRMDPATRFLIKQRPIQRPPYVSITQGDVKQLFAGDRPLPAWQEIAIRSVLSDAQIEMSRWHERARLDACVPREETIAATLEITAPPPKTPATPPTP